MRPPELPSNVDVERLVLGSILLDDAVFPSVAASLRPDTFLLENHQRIFRRMLSLQARGETIDYHTLANELNKFGELEACGGLTYLISLEDGMPRQPHIDSYVRILLEKADLRRIVFATRDLQNRAMVRFQNPAEIAAAAQDLFLTIGRGQNGHFASIEDIPSLEDCGSAVIEYVREPELPSGSVVALTGDSGSGKSTLATAWARDAWLKKGVQSLFLDRENPLKVIKDRTARLTMTDGPHYTWWGSWLEHEAPLPDAVIIREWVKICDPKPLVVVDSLSAFYDGDQNDASAMRGFTQSCRRLANLGATVIIIHHDGKAESAKDYRGSSDFKAGIDQAFHVSNFGEEGLDKVTLRAYKSRYGFVGSLMYCYADGKFLRAEAGEAAQSVTEQLVSLLRTNPGIRSRQFEELAAKRNLGRNRARMFLNDGLLSGLVEVRTGPGSTKRYYLVDASSGFLT